MRVFLFGAGASHSYDRSPSGIRPPLSRGFFEAYNKLGISTDRLVLVGNLVNYVRDTRGVSPWDFGVWNENIEDFLTEIDELICTPDRALALPFAKRFQANAAFTECVFLFASILNEIQNGPPCTHYSRLVRSLEDDAILITFNWDTLLDRVLWETRGWQPSDGYGLQFRMLYSDGWVETLPSSSTSVRLLKLHGSTNWLIPYYSLNPRTGERQFANPGVTQEGRPLFCYVQSRERYKTYQDRAKAGYTPFSYYYYPPDMPDSFGSGRQGWTILRGFPPSDLPESGEFQTLPRGPVETMPFIVAPVRHKEHYLLDDAIQETWRRAEEAIAACAELTIIGYSFPPTDLRAWDLLAKACARRSSPLQVEVINPSAGELARRLQKRLGDAANITPLAMAFSEYVERFA
jgi:hypothetical protein